uniref:phosphodiesterase I n=1 Tax=Roseihalotalea indica TaxID=2867963 RepID=A0AA49GQ18_9BACT|nr:VRR-NUC domain-containing protein [Tunicatimonas sp. TK19036]
MSNFPQIELPEKYYLDNFEALLKFVEEKSGYLLNRKEKTFIKKFRALPEEARCLFIRLMNRKGCFFRADKLAYAEIGNLTEPLELLCQKRFFSKLSVKHADELADILCIFPKADLIRYLPKEEMPKGFRSWKKPELVEYVVQALEAKPLIKILRDLECIVRVNYEDEVAMLRFLYFGDIHSDMSQFVVRDLGIIKHELFDEDKLQAAFKTRKEAEDTFLMMRTYQEFRVLRDEVAAPADDIYRWFQGRSLSRDQFCALALPTFERLLLKIAKMLEQQSHPKFALSMYLHTDKAPARERRVRLLHKLGLKEEALELCLQIQDAPQNAEERFFAEDFYNRVHKKKRRKRATDFLHSSPSVTLPIEVQACVELGVLAYYQEQGYDGCFVENYLWRGFFGLLFWDIIFDEDCEALHHPFQARPADFYTPDFLARRKDKLIQRLKVLEKPSRFHKIIQYHYETKVGMSNPMVGWHESLLPLVEQCYEQVPAQQIGAVLMEMAKDLKENTRGFPDLFVWNEEGYQFIEVKSPNDQLSAQQLYWLHFFQKQGVSAQVLRVKWESKEL